MGEMNNFEILLALSEETKQALLCEYKARYPEIVQTTEKLFEPGEPTYYWFTRSNDVGNAWRLTIGKDNADMLRTLLKQWGADCAGQFWFCKDRHVWARESCNIITFQNMASGEGVTFGVSERWEPKV